MATVNNDGKAQELLPQFGGRGPTAWYELKNGAFVRHIVHPDNFGHGIGADVTTEINYIPEKVSNLVNSFLSMGAVLIDNEGVEELIVNETA